jgi:hypothetical protein
MAKKARKKSTAKTKNKTKPVKNTKTKAPPKRKKAAPKAKPMPKPKTIGDRLSNAYRTVVDTVTGTDQLRNKMEKPGTSETE